MATLKAAPLANPSAFPGTAGGDKKQVYSNHAEYAARLAQWTIVHDCVEGELAVKAKGETYLPNPDTSAKMTVDADKKAYDSYKARAVYYNVTGRTLEGHVGYVFSKPTMSRLTPRLEMIKNNIDGQGTTLDQLAKLNLARVLAFGRAGLLTDYPKSNPAAMVEPADGNQEEPEMVATVADLDSGNIRPKILSYSTFDIINWRTSELGALSVLTMVVLRESYEPPNDDPNVFGVECETQYRVLRLNIQDQENTYYTVEIWRKGTGKQEYELAEGPWTPQDHTGKPFNRIPFQFLGWQDNVPSVNSVPLYDLASLNLSHYRTSAEFEESVHLGGNPQLVFSGITIDWIKEAWKNKGVKFGSRTAISLPGGANAELHQADPNTLAKEALELKERQMVALGAALVEQKTVQRTAKEAGQEESVKVSVLSSSADNVSDGVTQALVWAGMFIGEEQGETTNEKGEKSKLIEYELNTDFDKSKMDPQERSQLQSEYEGRLISWTELRQGLKAAGVAFQDDKMARDEIDNDPNNVDPLLTGAGVDPITGKPKVPAVGGKPPVVPPKKEEPAKPEPGKE